MIKYKIRIFADALQDMRCITIWYNEQLQGLGSRFQKQAKTQIDSLKTNPHAYAIRYTDVRCILIKKFPFLIHFTVNEPQKLVDVFAVYHTSRDPQIWKK